MIKLSLLNEVWTVRVERTPIKQSSTDLNDALVKVYSELDATIGGLEKLPPDERRTKRLEDLRTTKTVVMNILP
jgi:hypothetical protein